MLKEIQKLFSRKGLMEQAVEACHDMLVEDWEMFKAAVSSLRESETAELALNIEEKDIEINKYERTVRKKVLTHLAVNDVGDLNAGLVLISIVIDIERIGDYTKNIVELAQHHPGKLHGGKWNDDLNQIEEIISKNFDVLIRAIEQADGALAKQLLDKLWKVKNDCDSCIWALVKEKDVGLKIPDAVALALYMRYLKRVSSHLMNVATSIVNPFHKIGYKKD
jgi:phosphate uptake regulator